MNPPTPRQLCGWKGAQGQWCHRTVGHDGDHLFLTCGERYNDIVCTLLAGHLSAHISNAGFRWGVEQMITPCPEIHKADNHTWTCKLHDGHGGAHISTNGFEWQTRDSVHLPSPQRIDHPPHYGGADNPYEAIKVIENWSLGFCLGNALKYICRAGKKPQMTMTIPAGTLTAGQPVTLTARTGSFVTEDLRKARWYLDREIQRLAPESQDAPRQARTTSCWFCGKSCEGWDFIVIPKVSAYRQAHDTCFHSASDEEVRNFNQLGVK